jgi:Ni,Fe-hydrogenase III small subunit
MSKWVLKGLRTGIVTTHYPGAMETSPGVSPGRPVSVADSGARGLPEISSCPTEAIFQRGGKATVDHKRCIHCRRCVRAGTPFVEWEWGYEWAEWTSTDPQKMEGFGPSFSRSLHIRFVDAGACGACMSEVAQLAKPHYNLHRLGFFFTPSPRDADVLLVAGPGTDHMTRALEKVYDSMPTPKKVVAVGTCSLSGGLFGPSFACKAGVTEIVPVDLGVPGCPPPPLAILHGLLVLVGRRPAISLPGAMDPMQGDTP